MHCSSNQMPKGRRLNPFTLLFRPTDVDARTILVLLFLTIFISYLSIKCKQMSNITKTISINIHIAIFFVFSFTFASQMFFFVLFFFVCDILRLIYFLSIFLHFTLCDVLVVALCVELAVVVIRKLDSHVIVGYSCSFL